MLPLHIKHRITELLSRWVASVKANPTRTDINHESETVLVPLLRDVLDLPNLRNLNDEQGNFPGIDLADDVKRVAIQVTSSANANKIRHTLQQFVDYNLHTQYDRLLIYILTEKKKSYSNLGFDAIIQDHFVFDAANDILDYRDIVQAINGFQLERAEQVRDYLEDCFGNDEAAAKPQISQSVNENKGTTIGVIEGNLYNIAPEREVPDFPIIRILHPRNPYFSGREALLDQLHSNLQQHAGTALTQAIAGLGGIGKTQLALEYSYRNKDKYDIIWWIRAEQPAILTADFAALAYPLKLPQRNAEDQAEVIAAVKSYLDTTDRWLLVFDNVVEEADVYPYLPAAGGGNILLTSRNAHWDRIPQLQVQTLARQESIDFMEARTGLDDGSHADALADALGDLPLALEQSAAYINVRKISFQEYLRRFNETRDTLWDDEKAPADYHKDTTVATTWSLAIQEVEKETPVGASILNLCAHFAPDDIPRKFLNAEQTTVLESMRAVELSLIALQKYSLIQLEEDALSLHRLVQAVVKDRLSDTTWQNSALEIVKSAWPEALPNNWPTIERFLPHAYACLEHKDLTDDAVSFLNLIAEYFWKIGNYAESVPLLQRALETSERILGAEHSKTLVSVNNLAILLKAQGNFEAAEPLYRRALEARERILGTEHPKTLLSVNNLAILLKAQGNLAAAEPLYRRALEARERILGAEHPKTLVSVNNLANLFKAQGNFEAAEPLHRRTLEVRERILGTEHLKTLSSVNNLASLLHAQGNFEESEALYRRALEARERILGEEHPDTLNSVNNLATLLQTQVSFEEAEPLYRRALEARERILGSEHPDTLISVNNLASLLNAQGNFEAAAPLYRRALEGFESVFGKHHANTASARRNLERIIKKD